MPGDCRVVATLELRDETDGSSAFNAFKRSIDEAPTSQISCAHSSLYSAVDGLWPGYRLTCSILGLTSAESNDPHATLETALSGLTRDPEDIQIKNYKLVSERGAVSTSAPVLVAVTFRVLDCDLAELDRWYEEEHITLLSKVPGWIYTTRLQLTSASSGMGPPTGRVECLAVHGYQDQSGLESREFKAATSTEWRTRVMKTICWKERRVWGYECDARGFINGER